MKIIQKLFFVFIFFLTISKICIATTIYNFTPLNGSGRTGPTSVAGYNATTLQDSVTLNSGIQRWTIPNTGRYSIEAAGARGGYSSGGTGFPGYGAIAKGEFILQQGDTLFILVGQVGSAGTRTSSGGGGGSFVGIGTALATCTPVIVAGGGGGVYTSGSAVDNAHGWISTLGRAQTSGGGAGGRFGYGGAQGGWTSGGGGFYGDGVSAANGGGGTGGAAFRNGGLGGNSGTYPDEVMGGFGGGGSTHGSSGGGAGGGGYSGGGGGDQGSYNGGGGGSYNLGLNQGDTAGANSGNGYIKIIYLS